jgi:hypothetical protein
LVVANSELAFQNKKKRKKKLLNCILLPRTINQAGETDSTGGT